MHHEQAQAARVVDRVLTGTSLSAALAVNDPGDAQRGRSLVQELAYGTLRHLGTLRAIVGRLATRPVGDGEVLALLVVALYQIRHTRAPAFAVVDRAVDAVHLLGRPAARGLVNALLRRYLRERTTLDAAVEQDPVARWSHPSWWIDRLRRDHPGQADAILAADNLHPPLTLRVNRSRTSREALLAAFSVAGVAARPEGAAGVIVDPPRPVTALPGYAEGHFAVQDLGAQLAAPLLRPEAGMRVLDACAAPGGKTTHLLELPGIELVALDTDAARLRRLQDNVERLHPGGDGVEVVQGSASAPGAWWDGRPFDRILADVPCSASGVVRRHPDAKWLRRPDDIAAFVRTQTGIVEALWPLLARGGLLLDVTCSVFRDENDARVAAFVARRPDALRETLNLPAEVAHEGGQLLPSPQATGHNQDGFHYALLRKA